MRAAFDQLEEIYLRRDDPMHPMNDAESGRWFGSVGTYH